MSADNSTARKILQIGNYPPPMCGWAVQTVLLNRELRRRGYISEVLNVNENRRKRSSEYVDVQNGIDFIWKVLRFSVRGYHIHAHLNAESPKLYLLDLVALSWARIIGRPGILTFHGGLPQKFFPKVRPRWMRWAFQLIFNVAGRMTCDSEEIKQAIVSYGIDAEKIAAIPCFSAELLDFQFRSMAAEVEQFLGSHGPVFLCYVSFRPEYRLPVLRDAMQLFRQECPDAGFIWLGFPEKEMKATRSYVADWAQNDKNGLLLIGNLPHDEFLSLLSRCFAYLRTPACDGVSSSVLESLALGIPVVASENGRRPSGVLTYVEDDPLDMCEKLRQLVTNYAQIKRDTRLQSPASNTVRMADWVLDEDAAVAAHVS
jgi:glycosyltransferase involved in cell wall biosynthesis